jgi:hypothetical protein
MDIASIFVPDEIRNATKAALALCPVTYAGLNETAADIIAHWEEKTGATFAVIQQSKTNSSAILRSGKRFVMRARMKS